MLAEGRLFWWGLDSHLQETLYSLLVYCLRFFTACSVEGSVWTQCCFSTIMFYILRVGINNPYVCLHNFPFLELFNTDWLLAILYFTSCVFGLLTPMQNPPLFNILSEDGIAVAFSFFIGSQVYSNINYRWKLGFVWNFLNMNFWCHVWEEKHWFSSYPLMPKTILLLKK